MAVITLDDITPDALKRYQDITVWCREGSVLIWDSHRLPTIAHLLAKEKATEIADLEVASLNEEHLGPVRRRIIEAGGERGLCA